MAEKKEIKFNKSMTSDKRNESFAYLIKNVLRSQTEGLYPGRDYQTLDPELTSSDSVVTILPRGTDLEPVVITKNASAYSFYPLGSYSQSNTTVNNIDAFGSDGKKAFYVLNDGKVYSLNTADTGHTLIGTLPNYVSGAVQGGFFDGLNIYWVGSKIYRHEVPTGFLEQSFTDTGFSNIIFVDFYGGFMVTGMQYGSDTIILFWDKKSTFAFYKRITIPNVYLLAGGNVDGVMQIVTSTASSENPKEQQGEIIISSFNNDTFKRINSIVAYGLAVKAPTVLSITSHISTDSDNMLFSVQGNDTQKLIHPDLSQNYIYKTFSNGAIEAVTVPPSNATNTVATVVKVFRNFNVFAVNGVSTAPKIYTNLYTNADYENYAGYSSTEYITDFYCNAYNLHTMTGFSMTFEKLFKNENVTPPTVGNTGILSLYGITRSTADVLWTEATDDSTPQSLLQYAVYISPTNNIGTVEDAETNGTIVKFYTQNISSFTVTGLTPESTYWVNVVVRNLSGKKSAYDQTEFETTDSLVTAWKYPTMNGKVLNSGIELPQWIDPENAYATDGVFATSNDSEPHQSYYRFLAGIPDSATVTGIEVSSKAFKDSSVPANLEFKITKTAGDIAGATEYTSGFDMKDAPLTVFNEEVRAGNYDQLWGTTFTGTEINDEGLGIMINGSVSAPDTYTIEKLDQRVLGARYLNYGTMTKLSDTKFVTCFYNDDNNELELRVFTVDRETGKTTMGTSYVVYHSTSPNYQPSLSTYDENHVVLFFAYESDDRGMAQSFVISDYSISPWGSSLQFDALRGSYNSSSLINGNHFINVWQGGSNRFAQVFELNISNGNLTAIGTPVTVTNAYRNSLAKISDDKYLVARSGSSNDAYATLLTVNLTTWEVTVSSDIEYKDAVTNYGNDLAIIRQSPVSAINIYSSDLGLNIINLDVNIGTSTITLGSINQSIGDSSISDERSNRLIHRIDDTHIVVFHRDSQGFATASTFVIDWGANTATVIDSVSLIDSPSKPDDFMTQACSVDLGGGIYVVAWVDEVNDITSYMRTIRVAPDYIPYHVDDLKVRVFYEE